MSDTGLAAPEVDLPSTQAVGVHVASLDGLRGVAVLMVLVFHMCVSLGDIGVTAIRFLPYRFLWAGVDLFFVLSGFLITGILLDTKTRPSFFRNFYARRFLRICPLYYAAIVVVAVLGQIVAGHDFWNPADGLFAPTSLFWPIIYLGNLAPALQGPSLNGIGALTHYWSLAVEEHFYLFWPLVVWACSRRSVAIIAGLSIIGSILLRVAFLRAGADLMPSMGLTPLRLDGLAIGAIVSLYVHSAPPQAAMARTAWTVLLTAGAMLVGIVIWRRSIWHLDPVMWTVSYTLVSAAGGALILIARMPGRMTSTLSCGLLRWFGKYSFGLYVWHPIILLMLLNSRMALVKPGDGVGAIAAAASVTAATILIAGWMSYHGFEKHFLAFKRFFPSGSAAAPAAPRVNVPEQPKPWRQPPPATA